MHEDKLYAIAMQCAKLNNQGCALDCSGCQFNVFNYVKDVREASLLKANAYTDFYNQQSAAVKARHTRMSEQIAPLLVLLVMCGLIAYSCSSIKSCTKPKQTTTAEVVTNVTTTTTTPPQQQLPPKSTAIENTFNSAILQMFMNEAERRRPQLSVEEEVKYLADNPNNLNNIPRIIRLFQRYDLYDVNGDSAINCIDYAVVFRTLYGSDARLIVNVNPTNGMNHMFIRVIYDDTMFMDIEPRGELDAYSMSYVWGDKYEYKYNEDVTDTWMKRWR